MAYAPSAGYDLNMTNAIRAHFDGKFIVWIENKLYACRIDIFLILRDVDFCGCIRYVTDADDDIHGFD